MPIGSQRLLEIARALASSPQVLLLDEPAAGLNTQETRLLGKLLLSIKKQGITIMMVEHDMELVMDISDDIAVLNFGKNIARGTPGGNSDKPRRHRGVPRGGLILYAAYSKHQHRLR